MTERDYPERLTGMSDYAMYIAEGAYQLERTRMDDKWMGVVRHALTAVGAAMVAMGWTDDATWITVSGAIMTFIPFVWSWMAKSSA